MQSVILGDNFFGEKLGGDVGIGTYGYLRRVFVAGQVSAPADEVIVIRWHRLKMEAFAHLHDTDVGVRAGQSSFYLDIATAAGADIKTNNSGGGRIRVTVSTAAGGSDRTRRE